MFKLLLPYLIFCRFLLKSILILPRQLLLLDFVRTIASLPSFVFFALLLRRFRYYTATHQGISRNTVEHNIRGLGELSAPRSHLLLKVATSVGYVERNKSKMKILSVGPRVEGEIINIIAYGFNPWNIRSIDLFTYSPFIGLGDMHCIGYPDSFFDVLLCGWVLGYSDDPRKAALEMLRVLKPGGVIVVANAYSALDSGAVSSKLGYSIGASGPILSCSRLRQLFSSSAELDVFFEYDASLYGYDGDSMIVGIRKNLVSIIDSD